MFQLGIDFLAALLCAGFIRLARWQARPSECLIKVQLTLPASGRGAISLPICSAKALPDMFLCSHSTACHPGSHQCTDPNTPAFSQPPSLILGQTRPQHKHIRPHTKRGMDFLATLGLALQEAVALLLIISQSSVQLYWGSSFCCYYCK